MWLTQGVFGDPADRAVAGPGVPSCVRLGLQLTALTPWQAPLPVSPFQLGAVAGV